MADSASELDAYRDVVVGILRSIPTHSQAPLTIDEIARLVQRKVGEDYSPGSLQAMVGSTIAHLGAFGIVTEAAGRYRIRGPTSEHPIAEYFLKSWSWYVRTGRALIDGWSRPGVARSSHALDSAVYLLSLMERKRVRLAGIEVEAARHQSVAFDLIKTRHEGKSYFLLEWDRTADQYQLIGGHCTDDADPETTAIEELIEELDVPSEQRFEFGRDFGLDPESNPAPFDWRSELGPVRTLAEAESAYRAKAKLRHPDSPGGSHESMARLNQAIARARLELQT